LLFPLTWLKLAWELQDNPMPIIHNNRDVTDEIKQQIASKGCGDGTVERSPVGAILHSLMQINPDINLNDLSIAGPQDTVADDGLKQGGVALVSLSEIASPTVDLSVVSARGTPGKIANIRTLTDREVNIVWRDVVHGEKMILIQWESGKTSEFPHSKLEYVLASPPVL
jgi:hypothetical protein